MESIFPSEKSNNNVKSFFFQYLKIRIDFPLVFLFLLGIQISRCTVHISLGTFTNLHSI